MSIDKESYMRIREEEEIPLSLFYEFYKDKGGLDISLEEFEAIFPQFMQRTMGGMINTKNGVKFIDFKSIVDKVYKHFDEKFLVK